ncbi:MAG: hypothetical protein CMI08_14900 [Oceanospirillaceae bacterium]|nr:hypothetical protein [Oceanospirillaceae bacterium]MBL34119.1 hypothetical protein [Oceanospirillaceae bacterium]MBS55201.1 hypothetical protein [Oceanospirillaceae bacterium]|tara:strand:- start:414 stop:914 length:501 start_codon:yes stop_codon:yes gene_type:complete
MENLIMPLSPPALLTPATMHWLLEHSFDPQQPALPGRYQDTALIAASRQGERSVVVDLLSLGAANVAINHRNMDGTNALWAAVVADDFVIATALLRAGIDIDNLNDNGASTLMYASSAGKTEWVQWLLSHGADTVAETLDGFTALDLAANIDCLRLLKAARKTATA